jgi:hypothetical protein
MHRYADVLADVQFKLAQDEAGLDDAHSLQCPTNEFFLSNGSGSSARSFPGNERVAVLQIDLQTNEVVRTHLSMNSAAAEFGGTQHSSISRCCSGEQRSAYGFGWRRAEGTESISNASPAKCTDLQARVLYLEQRKQRLEQQLAAQSRAKKEQEAVAVEREDDWMVNCTALKAEVRRLQTHSEAQDAKIARLECQAYRAEGQEMQITTLQAQMAKMEALIFASPHHAELNTPPYRTTATLQTPGTVNECGQTVEPVELAEKEVSVHGILCNVCTGPFCVCANGHQAYHMPMEN